tara:strand:+ start:119 stop:370 length:252 start_codon:yes stop_codon:yes gene_type:complete
MGLGGFEPPYSGPKPDMLSRLHHRPMLFLMILMLLKVIHGSVIGCFLFFAEIACWKLFPCSVISYALTTDSFLTTGVSAVTML